MIALFPFLWLFWQFDLHSFLTDEFLDMINKTKNTNVGNDNLDNDSNEAPGDSEEDDSEGVDETKDKLLDKEWIRGGHQQDLGRSGLSSQDFKSNFSEKIHNS